MPPSQTKTTPGRRRASPPTTPTGRVRATGLSRERIVTETIRYLRAHPHENLTIAKAAAAVGATTMAIYRHFRDGADLAESIVDKVLEGISDEIPRDADWRRQVQAWMDAIYRRLLETPQAVELLTTARGLSTAWVRASEGLRGALSSGGLRDPVLTETTFWISLTVVGFARHMLAAPVSTHIEGVVAAINRLDPDGDTELSTLTAAMPRLYERARDIILERTLASIETLMTDKG